jgi:8-oxo-dGTP pyrophosphatase MutT (NUDIX family)
MRVAKREAGEETGLTSLKLASPDVFDIDIHAIPPVGEEPGHHHFDVRFLLEADCSEPLVCNSEAIGLRWIELSRLNDFTAMPSVLVLKEKLVSL